MKRGLLILIAVILASGASILFLGQDRDRWTVEPATGSGLVLSKMASTDDGEPPKLQIRCEGGPAQLRLYVPVRVLPAAGMAEGPAVLDLGEEFRDQDGKLVATVDDAPDWVVDGGYASRSDAAALITRMVDGEWLYLRSVAYSGERLEGAVMRFALKGLAQHKEALARACGGG